MNTHDMILKVLPRIIIMNMPVAVYSIKLFARNFFIQLNCRKVFSLKTEEAKNFFLSIETYPNVYLCRIDALSLSKWLLNGAHSRGDQYYSLNVSLLGAEFF